MRIIILFIFFFVVGLNQCFSQAFDTIISVGKHQQMQFKIIPGEGSPILFESGLGAGKEVWNAIAQPIASITGAPIICYNRLSLRNKSRYFKIGIIKEIEALEIGLKQLGYSEKPCLIVAHSLGGMYQQVFAARQSQWVKAAVFIDDANACSIQSYLDRVEGKKRSLFLRYLNDILIHVQQAPFPNTIPLIDIIASQKQDDSGNRDTITENMWIRCHKAFVAESAQRELVIANCVGHQIFDDNPLLVLFAITQQYVNYLASSDDEACWKRLSNYAQSMLAFSQFKESICADGKDDYTHWALDLRQRAELINSIQLLRFTLILHPNDVIALNHLADAYVDLDHLEEAIQLYERVLQVDAQNEHALMQIQEYKPILFQNK
jgi:tetratricopeptide (TPR) repeat protein